MGRTGRKKKRTHQSNVDTEVESGKCKTPQTFVIDRGQLGSTLKQLVMDVRRVMEPYTAKKLRTTKKNVLKDFVNIAGPMGVTHFIIMSRTSEYVYLKFARIPHGPTITFRVLKFALGNEVISSLKRPPPIGSVHYLTPPVLVLHGFASDSKPYQLMTSMFQNMYPTIDVQKVKLSELRRCVIYTYNKETKLVDFRHYGIKVVPRGMSRGVRKIAQSKLPNLNKYEDISEYVLGGGASESEAEEAEGEVTLGQDVPGRGNIKQQQSSVRLYEIGPRLTLELIKIESGLCNGEVLHHAIFHRSKEEIKALSKRIREQKHLKSSRKKIQEDNVRRKKLEKERKKKQERIRQGKDVEEAINGEDDNDEEWYKQEVGVAPDEDFLLNSSKSSTVKKMKRKPVSSGIGNNQKSKKRKFDKDTKTKAPRLKVVTGTVFRKRAQRKNM